MKKYLFVLVVIMSSIGFAKASIVTFDFTSIANNQASYFFTQSGLNLTIDNPDATIHDGLFSSFDTTLFFDGGATNAGDFTFSQNIRLVSYIIGNIETGEAFNFNQSSTGFSSINNSVASLGSFGFSNVTDIFDANQAIRLTSGNTDTQGYGFSSITVDTIPSSVPAPAAVWLLGSGLIGLIGMRKKSSKVSILPA